VFTTDNGAETFTFPDGGITPFKGSKMNTWEGGMRAPCVIRWPGVIKPGTVKNDIFASLDWLPTLVNIAGGAKGDALNKRIMAVPIRHRQDQARWRRPDRVPLGTFGEVGARYLLLLFQQPPVGVRYKNWKMYFAIALRNRDGLHLPGSPDDVRSRHGKPQARSIRDGVGRREKGEFLVGGALAGPVHGLHIRLEPAADRAGAVAEGAESYKEFPLPSGSGELQPGSGHGQLKKGQGHPSQ